MYNLKPCPFCGSEAVFVTFNRMDGQCSYKCGAVCCSDCACRTSEYVIDGYLGIETTEDDIVAIWNSRVNDEAD
mgnify:CR=1 FL=1